MTTRYALPDLGELAQARQAASEGRYTLEVVGGCPAQKVLQRYDEVDLVQAVSHDGTPLWGKLLQENAAFHRDNLLDMQEELADALNIAAKFEARLRRDGLLTHEILQALYTAGSHLGTIDRIFHNLYPYLPPGYRRDHYPVERILP
jgi:hypothetical protein